MRRTKRIHRVDVAKRSVAATERRIICFLTFVEANVLQQNKLAFGNLWDFIEIVRDQANRLIEQFGQTCRDRLQGRSLVRLPLNRSTEMRHDHDTRTGCQGVLQGRNRGANTFVGCDRATGQWHVQILSDQQALTRQRQLGQ